MTGRKYAGQYEEQLDPFAKFSQRERARKYMNLSPHDKVTLSMGRIILGSKTARTIAFFYTIFIHCLLYMVLYRFANKDSDCPTVRTMNSPQIFSNNQNIDEINKPFL